MLCGCLWITCRALWIELFLNLFNHASDTLVHITGKLSTHFGELSTKTGATCSFIVQAKCNEIPKYRNKKFVRARQHRPLADRSIVLLGGICYTRFHYQTRMHRGVSQMVIQTIQATRHTGTYEVTEAADYLRVTLPKIPGTGIRMSSSKLIRWIRLGLADASLVPISGYQMVITFEDLISMRVISFMRSLGISFHSIHQAHSWLKDTTGHPRPFATEILWLDELGAMRIYAEMENILAVANRGGQLAFTVLVRDNLIPVHNMTFDEFGTASSWSPERLYQD